jgi:hypothetical protein
MKEVKANAIICLVSVYFPKSWTLKQKLEWIYR